MKSLIEGGRQDKASMGVSKPLQTPLSDSSFLQDNSAISIELPQSSLPSANGKTSSILPPVHTHTSCDLRKERLNKHQAVQSRVSSSIVKPERSQLTSCPDYSQLVGPTITTLHQKQLHTARCFEALKRWHQLTDSGFLKLLLVDIQEVLHAAIYTSIDENAQIPSTLSFADSPIDSSNLASKKEWVEYFSLVVDLQEKLRLQRQEHSRLTTQLAMEKSLEQDLAAQLQVLKLDLAQNNLRLAYTRTEFEGEQRAVHNLEREYVSLTEQEQNLQSDCESLEFQLKNQQVQLEKARNQRPYLDMRLNDFSKRNMEEKRWQEQYATVTLQLQNTDIENRGLEDEVRKYEDEVLILEAQYARDVEAKKKAEFALSTIQASYDQFFEAYERTRACYTPRPDWDRIVDKTPELSAVENPWTKTESDDSREMTDLLGQDTGIDNVKVLRCLDKTTGGKQACSRQTKRLVKEMLHWIERLQKHCGANFHLSRMWHDVEEARVELNILHHQLDRAARKNSMLSILNAMDAGSIAAAASGSPLKIKQEYIMALGTHEGVPLFLRHCGKLKRKGLKKIDVDKVVRKVWVEKRKREQRNPLRRFPLEQVLYEKLYRKYGFQPLIAEWGYNILLALQLFSWDSEIELFLLCLTGAVSDLVYVDQEQMIQKCQQLLLRLCELSNVESFVNERRVLLKDALVALRTFFPLKTSTQLQAIEKAIIRDMHTTKRGGNDSILYIDDILPIDVKYPFGFFVKTIRTQHFKEIQDYYALLLRELEQRDTAHNGILPIAAIQDAILAIDPLANPGKVHHLIKKALRIKTRGQLHLRETVLYKAVLKQLNATCLMKSTLNFDQNAEVNRHRQPGVVSTNLAAITASARKT